MIKTESRHLKATLRSKVLLALSRSAAPLVLETHGGYGKLFASCYAHLPTGIVLEKSQAKACKLAAQRGLTWAVYECEAEPALRLGLGAHLAVNFVDIDSPDDPWAAIDAFLTSDRPQPRDLAIVVNDRLRGKGKKYGEWKSPSLEPMVQRFGLDLAERYVEAAEQLLTAKAAAAGYAMRQWTGYFQPRDVTHYAALLRKE